ncbi:MAG: BlaI/MecI/CopY family transcriptional regulator [Planctomycetes bacterium]|nr:BlaI/MecI/CopY family transcriptional regulator [Planctomycetota bacterium]
MKDKDRIHHLGELQCAIMRVLWAEGEASVNRVYEALPSEHRRALTTIATMLTKMEKKGVVSHRSEGRQFVYVPEVAESDVRRTMVEDLTERLFDGDVAALVSHLLTEQEIDREELARLQKLIEARRKTEKGHGR